MSKTLSRSIGFISGWISRSIAQPWQDFLAVATELRGVALTSLLISLGMTVPDPTREIYLQMALNADDVDLASATGLLALLDLLLTFFLLALMCSTLWFSGRWLVNLIIDEGLGKDRQGIPLLDLDGSNRVERLAKWLPRIFGAFPALAGALGLYLTAGSEEALGAGARDNLMIGAWIAVGVAFLVFLTFWKRYQTLMLVRGLYGGAQLGRDAFRRQDRENSRRILRRWQFWLYVLLIAALMFIWVDVPRFFGPVAIAFVIATAFATITTGLSYLYERYAFPALTILIGAAVALSVLDLNDNHRVEMTGTKATPLHATSTEAFEAWLDARLPGWQAENPGTPFPVHVVATQGGALYAAYHTASFLSRMESAVPRYDRHLFAISGVSGGSVGATVFTGIQLSGRCRDPGDAECHIRATRAALRDDFLSPALASLGLTDFTARFVPIALVEIPDRAKALQAGFTTTFGDWSEEEGKTSLGQGIIASWTAEGKIPALLLNTTDVTTGERMVLSPFHTIAENVRTYADLMACSAAPCDDPTILTAGIMSARFPIVSPAATLDLPEGGEAHKARFVDGGYFENSGVETAVDLIRTISASDQVAHGKVEIRLIVLDFPSRVSDKRDSRSYWGGELLSPVRGILATRNARTDLAKDRASLGAQIGPAPVAYMAMSLDNQTAQFTLNWMLAETTFDQIECDMDVKGACEQIGADPNSRARTCNRQVLEILEKEMQGKRTFEEERNRIVREASSRREPGTAALDLARAESLFDCGRFN